MSEGKGIKLKCQRCGHEWIYKGKSQYYAPCSNCKSSVNIRTQQKVGGKKEQ